MLVINKVYNNKYFTLSMTFLCMVNCLIGQYPNSCFPHQFILPDLSYFEHKILRLSSSDLWVLVNQIVQNHSRLVLTHGAQLVSAFVVYLCLSDCIPMCYVSSRITMDPDLRAKANNGINKDSNRSHLHIYCQ